MYIPRQGDIIWITLYPREGNEQRGRRPALVVTNNTFNSFTKVLAMVCPITNSKKNLPIQPELKKDLKTSGVIMCDQAKILDVIKRKAEFIEKIDDETLFEVVDIINGFIEIE